MENNNKTVQFCFTLPAAAPGPSEPGGPGGVLPHPDFNRYVSPFAIRGADCAHQITTCPFLPDFRPSYGPALGVKKDSCHYFSCRRSKVHSTIDGCTAAVGQVFS